MIAPPVHRPQAAVVRSQHIAGKGAPPVYLPHFPVTQPKIAPAGHIAAPNLAPNRAHHVCAQHLPAVVQRSRRQREAAEKLAKWEQDVRTISRGQNRSTGFAKDGINDLINEGPFRDVHPEIVLKRKHRDPVSRALGLTRDEETALYKYSQGKKDEESSYGYMEPSAWRNLETAVNKIPSMGALGLTATVYRGDRTTDFADFLSSRIGKPCYIIHGGSAASSGIHHLASAAFVTNSHGLKAKTLVRIVCTSARYIQYWGMHGASLDGGEVLIPAGTITYFNGERPTLERFEKRVMPTYTLTEVAPSSVDADLEFFDDFKGAPVGSHVIRRLIPGLADALSMARVLRSIRGDSIGRSEQRIPLLSGARVTNYGTF